MKEQMFKYFLAAACLMNGLLFAGTKKLRVITEFDVSANPDSVTATWKETPEENITVVAVGLQRRLKGVTETEGWENFGSLVPGGQEYLTVDAFTLDKDYEYRGVAITEETE